VHKVAEDRQRFVLRGFHGQRDGVAHAKAHAQMFCTDDFHGLCGEAGHGVRVRAASATRFPQNRALAVPHLKSRPGEFAFHFVLQSL
jgi:hypothetical protein